MNKSIACLVLLLLLGSTECFLPFASAQQQAATEASPMTLRLAGLGQPVTIRRDERGIPYIEATNDADLYFAQGYATASDRLWQMDLLRRTARGELSEIFGKVALNEDKRRRTLGYARLTEQAAAQLTPQTRSTFEAYARGVNAFIDSLDEKTLPREFRILGYRPRSWTVADSLTGSLLFAETLSTTWSRDLLRLALADLPAAKRAALLPRTSPLDVIVLGSDETKKRASFSVPATRLLLAQTAAMTTSMPLMLSEASSFMETTERSLRRVGLYMEDAAASNNWVVSGKRTMTGKPLLADDPHLAPSAPSIWHMTNLSAPGVRVAGVTAPGLPGIIIGHNERIAWGVTNLGPDVQDLYSERFDPNNPRRYMTPAGWRDAEVRREEIKVRKNFTDKTTETVAHEVVVTRHGPVVLGRGAAQYALRWTALDVGRIASEPFYAVNRARNWREFRAALRNYTGPTQNFVYADVDGHIGYYGAGLIPIRRTGDGSLPYDGATDAGEWIGFIPFESLPHVYDPPSGIIVTANSRIVGRSYPYHLTHEWAAPYRARRIYDLLTAKPKLSSDDFRRIQADVQSPAAVLFAREAVKIGRSATASNTGSKVEDDAKWHETLQLIESWDGRMNAESRAALLATEMRAAFGRRIVNHALGADRAKDYAWANMGTFLDRVLTEQPAEWLPGEFRSYQELLRACAVDAREAIAKRLGADEAKHVWGQSAQVRFPHPLASAPLVGRHFVVKPFGQNGSGSTFPTVNVGAGVSMRLIADASDWDQTRHGIAL
ncbi:MAG: penicillin acylase family protein, partial [Pyrinomonadaceae bacterium]|nr:penicillin acylase family protein [Pyrinomonadaceae bacterium]